MKKDKIEKIKIVRSVMLLNEKVTQRCIERPWLSRYEARKELYEERKR